MTKLPNIRESLDSVVAMPDGRRLGEAELFAVSGLPVLEDVTAGSFDPKGVPWKVLVMKDYRVQKAAVAGGVIKKESALPPHFALDTLRDNDPDVDNYSVMGILVPSSRHSYGIMAIGIIRPDVARFEDGEPRINLWFNALMDPAYHKGTNRAHLTAAGFPSVADVLVTAAMERMKHATGTDDVLVFSDDQCSISIGELVSRHGFKVLLEDVEVSSLPERRKRLLDAAANTVNLLVKPNSAYRDGMPIGKAQAMVKSYLVDGYDALPGGKLVRTALAQLNAQTDKDVVRYR
ncbi:hypothetical protein HYU17_03890 [Candidatus Woesearchaeota archaeon]|nr:hypothetical protein [Candidatus Woesearchaeota archaeon]